MGEVHITNENLKDFIRVAEALQIRGLSKDTSTTEESFTETNLSEIEDQDFPPRNRANTEDLHTQSFTSQDKRIKVISEQASLTSPLNDDEDMEEVTPKSIMRMQQQNIPTNSSTSGVVKPKTESLEFLEETISSNIQQVQQQQQQQQQSIGIANKNITYMNIENYGTDKNVVSSSPTIQQHIVTTRKTFSCLKSVILHCLIYFRIYTSRYKSESTAATNTFYFCRI